VKRWDRPIGFEDVKRAVEKVKGEAWVVFRDRQGDWGRDVALWLERRHTGLTLPEIAKAAGVPDHRTAGKAVERMEKRIKDDRGMKRLADKVKGCLSYVGT
jgi:chromosomal replication initiation ATPase DnaA